MRYSNRACTACEELVEKFNQLDQWGNCKECAEDRDVGLKMEHAEGEVE